MSFLYEKIDFLRETGGIKALPSYIASNLNPSFELRPYQIRAFENYMTWFESKARPYPIQNLFHMATGSGKTLIMAGMMLYLFKQGYRNFLFFVNLSNIVRKTEDNFLNPTSSKFLFSKEIIIDGQRIPVKKVSNFQKADKNAINICFTTIQGLHSDIWFIKENGLSISDFAEQKIVLISDEAHHLNVDTKKLKGEEQENYHSWEQTVKTIFELNRDNVLLEFTATCDLKNPLIRASYENKIIFDYPLAKFRADRFSKEIKMLRSDISVMDRALQATILSQYRLKVFQDNQINIKPIILFKSSKISESKQNMLTFIDMIANLTGSDIQKIARLPANSTMSTVWNYFYEKKITFDRLAQELKEDFNKTHCLSANDDSEADEKQLILNSLECQENPYRAIFEVKKLDEGWDVLNLFDIVRMYETRQSSGKKISTSTISEAQLIGRGARYCPFVINDSQEKFIRKFDKEIENPLRICEELYYHCQNDSRYIAELNSALKEIGLGLENTVIQTYKLKDSFKSNLLYKQGLVFSNSRIPIPPSKVKSILPSIKNRPYSFIGKSGSTGEDVVFESTGKQDTAVTKFFFRKTISEISLLNESIVRKALCRFPIFNFDNLQTLFPELRSIKQFIVDSNYLGDVVIEIELPKEPKNTDLFNACLKAFTQISNLLSNVAQRYIGSDIFVAHPFSQVFRDKSRNYSNPHDGGEGVSQNDSSVPSEWKLDLSKEDWFVFEDHFGTSEEKAFVAYFKKIVGLLKKKYYAVYLVRNERHLKLYSFDGGERFEPDFLLFLKKSRGQHFDQVQVFIEPKGSHLMSLDKWKEDFLIDIKKKAIIHKKYVDKNRYRLVGFHFFNKDMLKDFEKDLSQL